MKKLFGLVSFCFMVHFAQAQIGIGATASTDLYQRYANPKDDLASRSAGSAILNFGGGPKIWFGTSKASFSLEGQAVIGVFALSLNDYKGLGSLSFPIMAKINFGGLSALNKEFQLGLSLGAGIQYNRTELYGLTEEYKNLGVKREYFKTYVAQIGYGFGISGFCGAVYLRYGINSDLKANTLNFGLQYDFNLPMLKKIDDPASAL